MTRLCLVLIGMLQAYRRYGEAEWVISKHSAVAGCVLEDRVVGDGYKYEWMLLLPPALYQLPGSFVGGSNSVYFPTPFRLPVSRPCQLLRIRDEKGLCWDNGRTTGGWAANCYGNG